MSTILEGEKSIPQDEEKPEEPKDEGNGTCLGTVLVTFALAGALLPWMSKRMRREIQQ